MGYFDSPNRGPKANLLTQERSTPVLAPAQMLWKHKTANDAAAVKGRLDIPKASGLNCAEFKRLGIHVVPRTGAALSDTPGGTSTVTVTPYEWSDGDQEFVPFGSAVGPATAGESAQLLLDVNGKIVFIHVTGISGSASVYAQGFDLEAGY